jgi:hypothetical protein
VTYILLLGRRQSRAISQSKWFLQVTPNIFRRIVSRRKAVDQFQNISDAPGDGIWTNSDGGWKAPFLYPAQESGSAEW